MIQSEASDVTKLSLILVFKEILRQGLFGIVKIVNMIHDENILETPDELAYEWAKILEEKMEEAGSHTCKIVKLKATAVVSNFWGH